MRFHKALGMALLLSLAAVPATASIQVLGKQFRPDIAFPEYARFWNDHLPAVPGQDEKATLSALGGSVHVFLRNTGQHPVTITDVTLAGASLKRAIAYSDQRKFKRVALAASIYFSDLPEADRARLIAAGEPIWWRVEPQTLAPSAAAEIVIRLRRKPDDPALTLSITSDARSTEASVPIGGNLPRIEGISFSPELDRVYLYARHPDRGRSPTKIFMDGTEITDDCAIGHDNTLDVAPVVCRVKAPLAKASFHCFQTTYDDGSLAIAGIRAFAGELTYGIWGARPGQENEADLARSYLEEITQHSINAQMEMLGSAAVRTFMLSADGQQLMKTLGIRRVVNDTGKVKSPIAYYLADEPDTADYKVNGVPAQSKIGCLGQGLVARAEELRKVDPVTPSMLNVDMTFKPENWYIYGQLPDIYAADPYYQTRLAQAYWQTPNRVPLFSKATFVYAVGQVCNLACAPKPLHLVLNCTRVQKKGKQFRFGTPQEKRFEVYYALAAGTKGFSYWWYTPIGRQAVGSCGCGSSEPAAVTEWREVGLLGAEVRTAGPIITRGCPAEVPVTAPAKLWVRSLLAGTDTLVLLCVNDDYASDQNGTTVHPVANAEVSVNLPSWLDSKDVFEVSYRGIQQVSHARAAGKLNLHLGAVNLTRMIVITSDPELRGRLRKRYETQFAANVTKLTAAK